MASIPSFIFGAGTKYKTQEELERAREQVKALLGDIGESKYEGWGSVLSDLGKGIAARVEKGRVGEGQDFLTGKQDAFASQLGELSGYGGGGDPLTGGGGADTAVGSVGTDPVSQANGGGDMKAYQDAIAKIESGGRYDIIGPTHSKLGRAMGKYQIMEANIGPWSRKHLGREVTPAEFIANPAIQDAIFNGEFAGYVQKYGPEGAAQAWIGGPGAVGKKLNARDSLGTSVGEYGKRFTANLGRGGSDLSGGGGSNAQAGGGAADAFLQEPNQDRFGGPQEPAPERFAPAAYQPPAPQIFTPETAPTSGFQRVDPTTAGMRSPGGAAMLARMADLNPMAGGTPMALPIGGAQPDLGRFPPPPAAPAPPNPARFGPTPPPPPQPQPNPARFAPEMAGGAPAGQIYGPPPADPVASALFNPQALGAPQRLQPPPQAPAPAPMPAPNPARFGPPQGASPTQDRLPQQPNPARFAPDIQAPPQIYTPEPPAPAQAPAPPVARVDPFTDMILGDQASKFKPGNVSAPMPRGTAQAGLQAARQALASPLTGGGGASRQVGGGGGDPGAFPPTPAAPGQGGFPAAPAAPQGQGQQAGGGDKIAKLQFILASPYASKEQKLMAGSMIDREYQLEDQRQKAAAEAADPMNKLALEKAQLEVEALKNPQSGFRRPTEAEMQEYNLDPTKSWKLNTKNGEISQIGGGGVVVQTGVKGEDAFTVELGKGQAKQFIDMSTDGRNAMADKDIISEVGGLLQGAPGGLMGGLTDIAAGYGIPVDENMTDIQVAKALINKLVPSQRAEGSGTISDRDIELFKASLPNLWQSPDGRQDLVGIMQGLADYRIQQGNIASQVMSGELDRVEGNKKLMALPNPLAEYRKKKAEQKKSSVIKTDDGYTIEPAGN